MGLGLSFARTGATRFPAGLLAIETVLAYCLDVSTCVVMSHLSDGGGCLLACATRTALRSWFDILEEVDQGMGTETGPTVPRNGMNQLHTEGIAYWMGSLTSIPCCARWWRDWRHGT